jgi:ribosomal protein S18 acetylase RimI-like enzyme
MNINIRNVSIEDLDAVSEVEAKCFLEAEAALKASFEKRIKTFPKNFYVAEVERKIIGLINGCITNEKTIYDELFSDVSLHIPNGDYQAIFGLDVIPDYRNQGIAAQLMNHMIEASRAANRKGLILTCKEHMNDYYSKFGFKNKGISNSQHDNAVWYDMILEF